MLNLIIHILEKPVPIAILILKLVVGYYLFIYLRERNWKCPTIRELLTPATKQIDLLDFINLAEQQDWELGNKKKVNEDQLSIFIKILREAAMKGWVELSGRRSRLSEIANKIESHVQINSNFWINNNINIHLLDQIDNSEIKTFPDVEYYLENEKNSKTTDVYFDLRINESMARKWLTTTASIYKNKKSFTSAGPPQAGETRY